MIINIRLDTKTPIVLCCSYRSQHMWFDFAGVLEFLTTMTVLSNFTQGSYSTPSTEKKLSIKGSKANMWLCMNSNGQLYSSVSVLKL